LPSFACRRYADLVCSEKYHMPRSCPSSHPRHPRHPRLVSAWDHAPAAKKSSWCRPRLRVLACLIRCQAVSALLLENSNLHTNCKHASKQAVHALLHNLSLCTLVQSIISTDGSIIHFVHHFPSCPSFMSIIFPLLPPAQPSLSVGNNRDSDATINLLRRDRL
jgi:hypothetical protein